ncbi:LmbU family transcriptional regulator [Streptomyces sp. NPDC001914]|uniref:LmbU family transcriptional regulator n=1 Tax=Streptomyces sp. NPDC001914 TaxID=3364623 RepID=UPI0036C85B85
MDAGRAPAQGDAVLSFVGSQATVQKSGMVLPPNLPERSWERIGANLRELVNSSAWWLADWLLYGEATYGWRRYKEAIERTGLDYQTLRNYAWVARRFEHHRRRDSLSFAHHAEVTRLSPPEQDYWLRRAEQQKWSRNELRRAVRAGLAAQSEAAATCPDTGTSTDTGTGTGTGTDTGTGTGTGKQQPPRPTGPATTDQRQATPGQRPPTTGQRQAATEQRPPTTDQRQAATEQPQPVTTLTIELSADQLEHYSRAAAAHGLPVAQWVTRTLDTTDRHTPDLHTAGRHTPGHPAPSRPTTARPAQGPHTADRRTA